jgi:hypothetical protein
LSGLGVKALGFRVYGLEFIVEVLRIWGSRGRV